jgi:catechol 2,3-dioxygenase-like lactoylglutathione lyase family enzyme/protein tyrosine phosphatase (PTP) superfamily phosphohydrolase (DUF442 family)
MTFGHAVIAALAFVTGSTACATRTTTPSVALARPIALDGVPNLYRVSDELYRGGQPTAEGMRNLQGLGIKTIVNLRSFHSDRDEIGNTGLAYEHIYMKTWHPERKEAVRFLQIVSDPARTPVLVHCWHGADRTGTMCALYRIAVQGWTKEHALWELTNERFGFHHIYRNLLGWIRRLDIESIKKEAGITAATATGQAQCTEELTMECIMDHIVLNVRDIERMLDFYTNVLALAPERLDEYRAGKVPFPSVRLNDDTIIDLFPRNMWENDPSAEPGRGNLNHFCIAVSKDTWDALSERLQKNKVEIEEGPVPRWGAHGTGTSIYFRDPEGNRIEARYYEGHDDSKGCTLGS